MTPPPPLRHIIRQHHQSRRFGQSSTRIALRLRPTWWRDRLTLCNWSSISTCLRHREAAHLVPCVGGHNIIPVIWFLVLWHRPCCACQQHLSPVSAFLPKLATYHVQKKYAGAVKSRHCHFSDGQSVTVALLGFWRSCYVTKYVGLCTLSLSDLDFSVAT